MLLPTRLLLAAAAAFAAPPPGRPDHRPRDLADVLEVRTHSDPIGKPFRTDGYATHMSAAPPMGPGRHPAPGLVVWPRYLNRLYKLNARREFFVMYPEVSKGDLVPVLGRVYVAAEIRGDIRTGFLSLKRLPDEACPPGVTCGPDSLHVPLRKDKKGGAQIHDRSLVVESIAPATARGGKAIARIGFSISLLRLAFADVRAGDTVLLGDHGHEILSVVPPAPKARIMGWVELNAKPIPKADLIKSKAFYVVPKPINEK